MTEKFPTATVYVVEPEGFDDYAPVAAGGRPERNAKTHRLDLRRAAGARRRARSASRSTAQRLAGGLVASDAEALAAVGFAFDELKLVVEPGGAVGLAALLAGRLDAAGRTVVIVLSGGNIGDDMLAEGSAPTARPDGRLDLAAEATLG